MREYKSAVQNITRGLLDPTKGIYERYVPRFLGRETHSLHNYEPDKGNPYYKPRRQKEYRGNFEIPLGTGYPELKPAYG